MKKKVLLIILDGWGYSKNKMGNAIMHAKKKFWDWITKNFPSININASGNFVGLPNKHIGNSEVGHMHIGAGRLINQYLSIINKSFAEKKFFKIQELNNILKNNNRIHVIGLFSSGGVHSNYYHIIETINFFKKYNKNYSFHMILDGRDTAPMSAKKYIKDIIENNIFITSIIGRYYAMDRDNRIDRTKKAYNLFFKNQYDYYYSSPIKAIEESYKRKETDEFVKPILLKKNLVSNKDDIIFMNFRSDRMIQIVQMTENSNFFNTKNIYTLTKYYPKFKGNIFFKERYINNTLGEIISKNNLRQLRIAETEKFAHVTYFLNGGKTENFFNEDRILIPSLKVNTYDNYPEMSAKKITNTILSNIKNDIYDIIICNYANLDMIGHTGNFESTIKSVEFIDKQLSDIYKNIKKYNKNVDIIITADHGNAENMINYVTSQPHTAHTNHLVPFIYIGKDFTINKNNKNPSLIDISPTILKILNIDLPKEMTGISLLTKN